MELKTLPVIILLGLIGIAVLSIAQAAPPFDSPGNVLDRITELENRIDVLESQVADLENQVAELQEQGDPEPMIHFGEWQKVAGWHVYQAETDGFVVCFGDGNWYPIKGYTGPDPWMWFNPDQDSLRVYVTLNDQEWGGCVMPVRAGDYWQVDNGDVALYNNFYVYWIPLIPG